MKESSILSHYSTCKEEEGKDSCYTYLFSLVDGNDRAIVEKGRKGDDEFGVGVGERNVQRDAVYLINFFGNAVCTKFVPVLTKLRNKQMGKEKLQASQQVDTLITIEGSNTNSRCLSESSCTARSYNLSPNFFNSL